VSNREHHATIVQRRLEAACDAVGALAAQADTIVAIADSLGEVFDGGGTMITCGNGGSAAEALHFAEELIGRFGEDRPPLKAVCLNADATALTCIANDYGFDAIYARQCEALAGSGDAVVAFSTSGHSTNVVKALEVARANGARTIGLLGGDGGEAAGLCDISLIAPGNDSAAIQETHQVALHAICNCFEPQP
jgi:D-sedoheptulose 7-phosphate isomerase